MCKVWLSSGARHTTRDPPPVRCQPLENDHHGVRSLSPLVRKIHDKQVDGLMVELCDKVLDGKEEQRDICSIGLKSAILELPMSTGSVAVRKLTPKLLGGLTHSTLEVKLECMDILNDLFKRFGTCLSEEDCQSCLDALFNELGSPRAATRKRAISCIASLSAALSHTLLNQLVVLILTEVNGTATTPDLRRTYIQTISAFSRSGGHKLGAPAPALVAHANA